MSWKVREVSLTILDLEKKNPDLFKSFIGGFINDERQEFLKIFEAAGKQWSKLKNRNQNKAKGQGRVF